MKYVVLFCIFLAAILLESAVLQVPLVLLSILLLGILFQEAWVFFAAFLAGIFLDMLSFRTIGVSSIFFVLMLGLVFLYQRKFEIQSIGFAVSSCAVFTFFYSLFFGLEFALVQLFIGGVIGAGVFWILALAAGGIRSKKVSF